MTFEFLEMESVLREREMFEGGAEIATPEWLTEMLKAAWHHGNIAGDLAAYSNGMIRDQNPFMTREEREAYYGHAADTSAGLKI
jgi:hypothetical protein